MSRHSPLDAVPSLPIADAYEGVRGWMQDSVAPTAGVTETGEKRALHAVLSRHERRQSAGFMQVSLGLLHRSWNAGRDGDPHQRTVTRTMWDTFPSPCTNQTSPGPTQSG